MDLQRKDLIARATATHKKIYPCGTTGSFSECFTVYKDHLLFWFDTEDHSTHVEVGELSPPPVLDPSPAFRCVSAGRSKI